MEAARLAERAMLSCNNPFTVQREAFNPNPVNNTITALQEAIKQLTIKVDKITTDQIVCNYCGRIGHLENRCRSKYQHQRSLA